MAHAPQIRIPATYMRGGTSKGVFFRLEDLPERARVPGPARDALLLRVIGSPDPYGKQIDGMGGATSSTSKVVIVSPSTRADCDVDYLFGAVAIDVPLIDWSGNCGNLSAAVGPFAIGAGLVQVPADGAATVRIWQTNIGKKIIAHIPMRNGEVVELGDFELDGVTFPAAEIKLEFLDPGVDAGTAGGTGMFPTGRMIDQLQVPGVGTVPATLIDAGNATIFVDAVSLGLEGTELQEDVNRRPDILERAEAIRAHGAVAMGFGRTAREITEQRPHTPKLAFVASAADYVAADGTCVSAASIDLLARIFSMGQLHHAMTGTGAIAIAAAACTPGTLVNRLIGRSGADRVRFGHPSGTLHVGVDAVQMDGRWSIRRVLLSRSARRLMEGWVRVPAPHE